MMTMNVRRIGALCAGLALAGQICAAKPKPAPKPACWTIPEIDAAKVNEFGILLNVQALRCRIEDTTIQDQYDAFTKVSGATLKSVDKTLKNHFRSNRLAYDRYTIGLANKYGAGVKGQSCAQFATLMQTAIGAAGSQPGLSQAAETVNISPTLEGGACPLHPLKPFIAKPRPRRGPTKK